ncbi:hypothetical protein PR003_g8460 [Phytophthora rubi]|uniref:Uncharacterized protein n=1 Tax=Phytophthora rubi TaxID=129364 RepID=A0A6A3MK35_9STRA|nr:hypothetical protein PR002_g9964 [Phytophthora rubi]KAE9042829.1 hypothetical protein PR001_g6043 [Phytophthora rubi]KAE9344457.1 hypothetical protein PR003_g8460 [Phytophthora rubi]
MTDTECSLGTGAVVLLFSVALSTGMSRNDISPRISEVRLLLVSVSTCTSSVWRVVNLCINDVC